MRSFLLLVAFAATGVGLSAPGLPAQAPAPVPDPAPLPPPPVTASELRYTPHRVYDTKRKRFVDLETLIAAVARTDVAFLGEFHNDPGTHALQAAVLEGIARRRNDTIVLALEMFERDVQPHLDAYLADSISEADFLAASRPWGNYRTDYRPMVELAKARGWPVVAGNVPRRLASVVARRGLSALDSVPEGDRPLLAAQNSCPRDEYFRRFREVMGDMTGHGMTLTPEQVEDMVWRTYEAQCVKDEVMGESIVRAREAHRTLVVHANGAFHSDYRLGTVERVRRRAPRTRTLVVSFVPVTDLDAASGRERRRLGDYVVFTLAPASDAAQP
jgi:uncharacterized iron-regulated protein